MCKILMSINPIYADKILSGTKKYEYRKVKAKKDKVNKIVIYATYPIMKVVGEVEVKDILEETPEKLWNVTKEYSGVTKQFYDNYFNKSSKAIAYKLGKIEKYDEPKKLEDVGVKCVPQSFLYLDY
jgi:predicted transcriptional regulator